MSARHLRRLRITLWTLCCLLVSQWALAAHACTVIQRAGGAPVSVQMEAGIADGVRVAVAGDCHGFDPFALEAPADDSAICVKHCADEGAATGGSPTLAAAAMAPPPVIRTLPTVVPMLARWEQVPAAANATAPPLSILYCVFLN